MRQRATIVGLDSFNKPAIRVDELPNRLVNIGMTNAVAKTSNPTGEWINHPSYVKNLVFRHMISETLKRNSIPTFNCVKASEFVDEGYLNILKLQKTMNYPLIAEGKIETLDGVKTTKNILKSKVDSLDFLAKVSKLSGDNSKIWRNMRFEERCGVNQVFCFHVAPELDKTDIHYGRLFGKDFKNNEGVAMDYKVPNKVYFGSSKFLPTESMVNYEQSPSHEMMSYLAKQAVRVLGLDFARVDMVLANKGPRIFNVVLQRNFDGPINTSTRYGDMSVIYTNMLRHIISKKYVSNPYV
mgnify:CR=1 FL=1|tara:strand:+ start:213 stop:1103 length:891 start_codon:yes stop_codon:yes gene_type:complete